MKEIATFALLILFIILIAANEDGVLIFEAEKLPAEVELFNKKQKEKYNIPPYDKLGFQIVVSVVSQKLYLISKEKIIKTYDISTAKNGTGEEENSYKTPTGTHKIAEKFGEDGPENGIYIDRKFTGKIAQIYTNEYDAETDYITSRILWLDGIESHNANTKQRYIYIHGTHEEGLIGKPTSHGCIRMKNKDVIELFDYIPINTLVEIYP